MASILKNTIASIVVALDKLLVGMHIIKPRIVMYMDGGLCSQMLMWSQGQYYAAKGFDVYYDLEWFKKFGKGIDGISVRNYELQILWQNIAVRSLPSWKNALYKNFLPWTENDVYLPKSTQIDRSVYFKGYYILSPKERIRIYRQFFSIETAHKNQRMLLENGKRYCGVHVRRGDLANISIPYYQQVTEGYFLRAIKYVQENTAIDEYLLFSEDPQWLRENILPNVNVKCRIMEGNKGYEDLILLAQCQIIISSQGSFGPTAALLNPNCELLIRNTKTSDIPYARMELQID